jgi:hypothetical protein
MDVHFAQISLHALALLVVAQLPVRLRERCGALRLQ